MSQTKPSGAAIGFTMFASAMLILVGIMQALAGLSAVIDDQLAFWVTTDEANYWLTVDTTTWGWVHLVLGVVLFLAGLGLLSGQVWARTLGVLLAGASAIANFMFIPIYPWWSIIMITIAVFVIWALTVHGRDVTRD